MPVSNEADIIEEVLEEWIREVFVHLPEGSEIVLDEAGSNDGTQAILERLVARHPFIRVHSRQVKDGFGAAARRLYNEARCPLIFFTDSDGQYVPSEFWKLVPHSEHFFLVHGAKIGRQDALMRKIASAIFNRIARLIFDVHYSDINSAFRIVRKDVSDLIVPKIHCMPTLFNAEFLIRAEMENLPIKQVRVIHRKRRFGKSRGLPAARFLHEAWRAYRGLRALKAEYAA